MSIPSWGSSAPGIGDRSGRSRDPIMGGRNRGRPRPRSLGPYQSCLKIRWMVRRSLPSNVIFRTTQEAFARPRDRAAGGEVLGEALLEASENCLDRVLVRVTLL